MSKKENFERVNGKIVLYYDDQKRTEFLRNANLVLRYCNGIFEILANSKMFALTMDLVKAFSFVHTIEKKEEVEDAPYSGGVGMLKTLTKYKVTTSLELGTQEEEEQYKGILLADLTNNNARLQEMMKEQLLKEYDSLKLKCLELKERLRVSTDDLKAFDFSCIVLGADGLTLSKDYLDKAKEASAVLADTDKAEKLFFALRKIEEILNTEVFENMNNPEILPTMLNATRFGFGFDTTINYNYI